jgi:hypothetical protein
VTDKQKRKIDIKVDKAVEGDIEELLEDIRDVDIRELRSSTGKEPKEILQVSFRMPGSIFTLRVKGDLVCIFGIATVGSPEDLAGVPWMIGTNKVKKYRREFLDVSRTIFCTMCSKYRYLSNYVDDRNKDSIKWLQWLGFHVGDPVPFGIADLPFRQFLLVNNHV